MSLARRFSAKPPSETHRRGPVNMPIDLRCPCGLMFRAENVEAARRRVCPHCGRSGESPSQFSSSRFEDNAPVETVPVAPYYASEVVVAQEVMGYRVVEMPAPPGELRR